MLIGTASTHHFVRSWHRRCPKDFCAGGLCRNAGAGLAETIIALPLLMTPAVASDVSPVRLASRCDVVAHGTRLV